jgi:ABC-type phosphate/phosphonate transport system substrate-binding protein
MKLAELKREAERLWGKLVNLNQPAIQVTPFKAELHNRFGDLRYRQTWQRAIAQMQAEVLWASGPSEVAAIYALTSYPESLRHEIQQAFLGIPGAIEFLARGLNDLYQNGNSTEQEKIYELIQSVQQSKQLQGVVRTGG